MAIARQKLTTCLWFDSQAEEAAQFYVSVFKDGKVGRIARYAEAGKDIHGHEPGSVMTVEFEIEGRAFLGLNGGPIFKFSEAVSLIVNCETQDEIDYYWQALSAGGAESVCGWLKDKFGLSWQVVPSILPELIASADTAKRERTMAAVMQAKKFDIDKLTRAAAG